MRRATWLSLPLGVHLFSLEMKTVHPSGSAFPKRIYMRVDKRRWLRSSPIMNVNSLVRGNMSMCRPNKPWRKQRSPAFLRPR